MKKKDLITIIVPCLNEEECIPLFYQEIKKVFTKIKDADYELIMVDDGSKDNTLKVIKKLASKDNNVKYLSFSRNFGKEAAMLAGLKASRGNYITIMDVDLQDPPELLIKMYKEIAKGSYDLIGLYTKSHRDYNIIRSLLTKIWYKIIDKMSFAKQVPGARDFRLMTRQVADCILSMPEYNRYLKGMFDYVGFETKWLEYETPNRVAGNSKFNLRKLIKYSLEGMISSSAKLLTSAAYIGLFFCLIAFIAIIVIIVKTLVWGDPVSGWPSLACLIIFLGGIQLLFLGVVGVYLSKIYLEVKVRPSYIIKEKNIKE